MIANLRSAMEYRASFISQVVFMFLNDVLLLFSGGSVFPPSFTQ